MQFHGSFPRLSVIFEVTATIKRLAKGELVWIYNIKKNVLLYIKYITKENKLEY